MPLLPAARPRLAPVSAPTPVCCGISLLPLLLIPAGGGASGSVTHSTMVHGEASVGGGAADEGGVTGGPGDLGSNGSEGGSGRWWSGPMRGHRAEHPSGGEARGPGHCQKGYRVSRRCRRTSSAPVPAMARAVG